MRNIRFITLLLVSGGSACAHLDTLTYPKAGITLKTGTTVAIVWQSGNIHNGIDVQISTDDKSWGTIVANLGKSATSYNWKIPDSVVSTRARIRICQKSGPQGCTDADTVNNPTEGPTYWLVSGRFTIEAASTSARGTRFGLPEPRRHARRETLDALGRWRKSLAGVPAGLGFPYP